MNRSLRLLACLLALGGGSFGVLSLGVLAGAGAAWAQAPGVGRSAPARGVSVPPPLPDPPTSAGNIGTRLEPGAVLCRTPEGLRQRQAALTAQNNGDNTQVVLPTGCFMLTTRTPVEVLERRGFGRTQVKTLGRGSETGWTDAYVPAR